MNFQSPLIKVAFCYNRIKGSLKMTNKQQNDEAETITLIGLCTVLGISLFTIFGIIPFIINF